MRHSFVAALTTTLLSLALAQGCGGKVSESDGAAAEPAGPRADTGPASSPPSSAGGSTSGDDAAPADTNPPELVADTDPTPRPEPKTVLEACDPGTDAVTHVESFVGFEWSREHPGCGGSSSCAVSFQFAPDCTGSGYYHGIPYTLRLPSAECRAFQRWVTSDRLLGALRDESICPGGAAKGNPEEMGTALVGGTTNRKIDPVCDTAPFLQNRQCIDAVLTGYVPGPTVWP